jgi:hypothetical protein
VPWVTRPRYEFVLNQSLFIIDAQPLYAPTFMPHPLEQLEPNEAALITEMSGILRRKMERDYAKGTTLRDAHPKSLGVLRGTLSVEPGLPAAFKVGIFKQPVSYPCWARASNASGKPQSDAVKDFRGLAIKLMGPASDGKAGEAPIGQDFVLMNFPTMPLGTVKLFRDAVYYTIERAPWMLIAKMLLTGHGAALKALNDGRSHPNSPLDEHYWSTTPYQWGSDAVVKYALKPSSAHTSAAPAEMSEHYLSDAMQQHLAKHPASFDLCVQLRQADDKNMPIENAAVRWSEQASPFVKVATLRFDKQQFQGVAEREALAEVLSFSPGHAWPQHAPLGGINRARAAIYKALSKFRHQRDKRKDIA